MSHPDGEPQASSCPLVEVCVRAHGCAMHADAAVQSLLSEDQKAAWKACEPVSIEFQGKDVTLVRTYDCLRYCREKAAAIISMGDNDDMITFSTPEELQAELKRVFALTDDDRNREEQARAERARAWQETCKAEFQKHVQAWHPQDQSVSSTPEHDDEKRP